MRGQRNRSLTPVTLADQVEFPPTDPGQADPLPPAPAVAAWSDDSGPGPLADLVGTAWSRSEANALLRAAAPRSPAEQLEARLGELEARLQRLERPSLFGRLISLFRRRPAGG